MLWIFSTSAIGPEDTYFKTISQVLLIAMFRANWPGWWPRGRHVAKQEDCKTQA